MENNERRDLSKDVHLDVAASGSRFLSQESDEPTFEENVLAEERVRQRTLHSIRFQSRQRHDSISSGDGEAVRGLPVLGPSSSLGTAIRPVDASLTISMGGTDQDSNGVRAEVDVRQQLFEEPEAYPHTIDFQRVIITDTNGKIYKRTATFKLSFML